MALILAFRSTGAALPGKRLASEHLSNAQSAELIIFPGVRYERHADGREPEAKGRRSFNAKPRELIDLMD